MALRKAWDNLLGAVSRNENIGAPAVTALFYLVYLFFERRYCRFVILLVPCRLFEEVLANVARQLVELRVYFNTLMRNLADQCTRRNYAELAQYAGSCYVRLLLGPTMRYLLDIDVAGNPLSSPASPFPSP